jgi:enediyne biosynthesis protein E4
VIVLQNVVPMEGKHWVGIELAREKNKDFVGARVVLETALGRQTKFAKGGGSFASTNDPRLVFGLGADSKIDKATIYWPSGEVQDITGIEPDAYWKVTEREKPEKKKKGSG